MKTSSILLWNLKGRDIWFWLMDIRLLVAPEHPLKHCQFNVIWRHKVFALDRRLCYEEVTGTAELGVSAPPPPPPFTFCEDEVCWKNKREKKKENDEILKSCNLRQNLLETFRFDRKYFMESPQVWKFSEEEWPRVPLQIRTPGAQYQAPPRKRGKRLRSPRVQTQDYSVRSVCQTGSHFINFMNSLSVEIFQIRPKLRTGLKKLLETVLVRQTSSLSL